MKNLRRFCLALFLCAVFALPAFAGDINTPPCTDPGDMSAPPGENNGPPCAAPGDVSTPPGEASSLAAGEPDVGQTGRLAASLILFALGGL